MFDKEGSKNCHVLQRHKINKTITKQRTKEKEGREGEEIKTTKYGEYENKFSLARDFQLTIFSTKI